MGDHLGTRVVAGSNVRYRRIPGCPTRAKCPSVPANGATPQHSHRLSAQPCSAGYG
jgi:hypothetical protein